ncbi:hypothetical protein K3495_g11903 [Podosphaera aphanis]|nr:hypothetical protein K3495_g11903 [Podosphaera aphanis]
MKKLSAEFDTSNICMSGSDIRKTPKYRFKKSRSIGAARRAAAEKAEIVEYVRRFEAVCNEKKIKKQNIWNFDETDSRIGCLGSQLVLIWAEQKQVYLADPENREYVTCMESVCADERTIDPMIIFQGAHYLEKHFDNDLNDDALFAQSESGYTNDYLSYRWLMHWERFTRPQNPEENRLLIMDGHGSHLTFEFINYCEAHKVFPFLLPPHSTHLLEPLDIGIFQQYKNYHQELLDDKIRIGGLQYKQEDFFRVLQRTRNLAFKKRTITFAFKQDGLVPCDPGVVLDKMNEFSHPERPCTPPPRVINWKECVGCWW